jgi:hypothetical protein
VPPPSEPSVPAGGGPCVCDVPDVDDDVLVGDDEVLVGDDDVLDEDDPPGLALAFDEDGAVDV